MSVLRKAIARARREGAFGSVRYAASVVYWKYRVYWDDTRFDRRYGVETSRVESAFLANVDSPHATIAVHYEASKQREFRKMMRHVPADRRTVTFIDVGCGKGRVLLFAALDGFEKIVGVEFSTEMSAIAQRNIETFRRRTASRASIDVRTQDIATFEFPDTDLVLYLYQPFGAALVQIVIDRVTEFARRSGRRLHIAYRNPQCADVFEAHSAIETIATDRAFAVYRLRSEGSRPAE